MVWLVAGPLVNQTRHGMKSSSFQPIRLPAIQVVLEKDWPWSVALTEARGEGTAQARRARKRRRNLSVKVLGWRIVVRGILVLNESSGGGHGDSGAKQRARLNRLQGCKVTWITELRSRHQIRTAKLNRRGAMERKEEEP